MLGDISSKSSEKVDKAQKSNLSSQAVYSEEKTLTEPENNLNVTSIQNLLALFHLSKMQSVKKGFYFQQ